MTVLIASTVAPWKCDGAQEVAWLRTAEFIADEAADAGHEVEWFCAVERDGRGDAPFGTLMARIANLGGTVWRFSVDDNSDEIDAQNRLIRICTGRNLAIEFAQRSRDFSHILFLDSDIYPPPEIVPALLALRRPLAGLKVDAYSLDGKPVEATCLLEAGLEGADVREHWNTAGCLMVERLAFSKLRWRTEIDAGLTDDPCFQGDAVRYGFGQTWVRHDIVAQHHPGSMVPVENRPGDRVVYR